VRTWEFIVLLSLSNYVRVRVSGMSYREARYAVMDIYRGSEIYLARYYHTAPPELPGILVLHVQ
jgi:hypothetical protein